MSMNVVEQVDDVVKIKHVLISVSDKSGLDDFIPELVRLSPEVKLFSTGGTYRRLQEVLGEAAQKHLIPVSSYTGQPETQGGLVKTLDFKIYLGLLTETYNESHQADLQRTQAVPIDMVVVNLYPFQATVAQAGVTIEGARGNIDIGGPCMLRASAKNFIRVAPVVNPADYEDVLATLHRNDGGLPLASRFELARKAFAHTAEYDTAIATYLAERDRNELAGLYKYN